MTDEVTPRLTPPRARPILTTAAVAGRAGIVIAM